MPSPSTEWFERVTIGSLPARAAARWGAREALHFKREPGHAITEDEVLAHCHRRIASFKVPRRVLFVDDSPMTSSGKIQKVKLREDALRLLAPSP